MLGLNELDKELGHKYEPSFIGQVHYLFWKKGISLKEFEELPIPYIFDILAVRNHIKEKEEKEMKKTEKKVK